MDGGGTQQSLRKYLGAIKDSTTVGLAKVNSDYKELDIAIVRATNHVERPAKDKHIKAIFLAISAARPRADVAYCIHALSRRLSKTHNWAVALKTLMVIHRALREVDPTFREELINYGRSRGHILNLSHFKDDSSANAWDCSAWVRSYASYLEERLECFHVLKYDVETDPLKTRDVDTVDLLVQLPALQQLLFRLINCQPQGAAVHNFLIQLALTMVASESTKIYTAISDGTLNMIDKFFEMQRHDALKALDIYRRSGQQAERLSEFYEVCKSIDIGRGEKFIKIELPPPSFLNAMEEYVREAPLSSTVRKDLAKDEKASSKVILAIEGKKILEEESPSPPPPPPPLPEPVKEEMPPVVAFEEPDLLGLHETNPDALELDAKNALALAILPVDNLSQTTSTGFALEKDSTGWELALVTAPSSNETASAASKLAGGLDKLTLDSLYDDAARRANQPTSYNPWEPVPFSDPFYASNSVAAPRSIQMEAMAQQQAMMLQHQQQQQMMMMMGGQQLHQPSTNPFGNSYAAVGPQPYGSGTPLQSSNTYTGFI
ncbi:putative clathrin assembly protein [Platanthera zijinensis]|uniref:Clathrin assembly protein n=1 Tax=Platanthera zijinensis TaxID=2320716 RepID=A0AAP0GDY9_9ASPA